MGDRDDNNGGGGDNVGEDDNKTASQAAPKPFGTPATLFVTAHYMCEKPTLFIAIGLQTGEKPTLCADGAMRARFPLTACLAEGIELDCPSPRGR